MKFKTNLTILLLVLSFVVVTNNAFADTPTSNQPHNETGAKPPMMKMEAKMKVNGEMRKDIRDEKREEIKDLHASTSMMMKDLRADRKEKMDDMRNSSTTMSKGEMRAEKTEMFKKFQGDRKEIQKSAKANEFKIRKDALVKQLNLSLENLISIRGKINDRITAMETEGKSVTEAKTALVIADDKLAKAKVAVDALAAYTAPVSNGAAVGSATAEVELSKPRQVGDAAIKAVKEARDALKNVAKLIGPTKEMTASSTAPTI